MWLRVVFHSWIISLIAVSLMDWWSDSDLYMAAAIALKKECPSFVMGVNLGRIILVCVLGITLWPLRVHGSVVYCSMLVAVCSVLSSSLFCSWYMLVIFCVDILSFNHCGKSVRFFFGRLVYVHHWSISHLVHMSLVCSLLICRCTCMWRIVWSGYAFSMAVVILLCFVLVGLVGLNMNIVLSRFLCSLKKVVVCLSW